RHGNSTRNKDARTIDGNNGSEDGQVIDFGIAHHNRDNEHRHQDQQNQSESDHAVIIPLGYPLRSDATRRLPKSSLAGALQVDPRGRTWPEGPIAMCPRARLDTKTSATCGLDFASG